MLGIADSLLDKLITFLSKEKEFVFLDTSRPDNENNQSLLFLNPVKRLVCKGSDSLEDYLVKLQEYIQNGYYLAGWVGYEFGAILEGRISNNINQFKKEHEVVADLGVFLKPYTFDHYTGKNDFPLKSHQGSSLQEAQYKISELRPNMTKKEFVSSLGIVQDYIAAGDTYQVNYTMKLLFDFDGDIGKLYSDLRRNQSVAYGAFLRSRGEDILSFSPELFFKKKGSQITARPMKGTAPRGRHLGEELQNSNYLHNDTKNRSENVMIVDLLRNDLARLMHGHGQSRVSVESLFDVESYESLLQMTSTIKADCAEESMQDLSLTELFRALFPCGSITGAPKIRTMQIIDELEKDRRGVYTGAIGYFGPDGVAAFSVPIRTVRLNGKSGEMGIGAGITHDSVSEEEWDESLLKGEFLTHSKPDFQLFETILYTPGDGYYLLREHLERLQKGARYFKFFCDTERIRRRLLLEKEKFPARPHRVRVELRKDGGISVDSSPCDAGKCFELPANALNSKSVLPKRKIAFSNEKVATENPWCFHKTTMRKLYNEEYLRAQESGLFDVVFCNTRGEVTEGCITNVVICVEGVYKTPPVDCGLLPGVMRQHLLNNSVVPVVEERITVADVENAEVVYLCNSVRGVVPVTLVR